MSFVSTTHRALGRQTALTIFNALIKARPAQQSALIDHRVRRDKIDRFGSVTIRYLGRLRHIRLGLAHKNRESYCWPPETTFESSLKMGNCFVPSRLSPRAITMASVDAGRCTVSCNRPARCL